MTELLFAELSIDVAIDAETRPERRQTLAAIRAAIGAHDSATAQQHIVALVADPQLRSRDAIWLWGLWRQAGGQVDADTGRRVLGVVIEVGMKSGLDVLAAYADHTARYHNYSGAAVVWEAASDREVDQRIDALLETATRVIPFIGPWEGARRPPPGKDVVRLNMLTPAGLHFGEGPAKLIGRDRMSGPVLMAGTLLMKRLTELARRPNQS